MIRFVRNFATIKRLTAFACVFGFAGLVASGVQAQTFSVVHSFTGGTDGQGPLAGLVMDASGNLYGTTSGGGESSHGTVFEFTSAGVETVLYNFTGLADGGDPEAALLLVGGTLYGTTVSGGVSDAGTVFEVTLAGKETVLYSFTGKSDGAAPGASLVRDSAGNFYGTTKFGGAFGNGTVFKLVKPKTGSTAWTEQVLYSFGAGNDGINPVAAVGFDSAGNIYGTASAGGTYGNGTVFQLKPSGSNWTENILHEFELLNDGGIPYAGLVVDHAGNLYGATTDGGAGGSNGGGTIFEMSPSGSTWTFTVLYSLPGWGISGSFRNLLVTGSKIYGTTHCDGANTAGTVWELTHTGTTWTYTSLYVFTGGTDGLFSFSNLVLTRTGDLYGTTNEGGQFGSGVLFKIHL